MLGFKKRMGTWESLALHISGWLVFYKLEETQLLYVCHFIFVYMDGNSVVVSLHFCILDSI